ncbi:MAG: lipoyl domain-containing protein [Steroidobacteraceae bacterium]
MRVNLKLARVGMNMQEATVSKWHKQPGEAFKAGEALYDIETEKVTQEVTATGDGTLLKVFVPEGENVAVGAPVCAVDMSL